MKRTRPGAASAGGLGPRDGARLRFRGGGIDGRGRRQTGQKRRPSAAYSLGGSNSQPRSSRASAVVTRSATARPSTISSGFRPCSTHYGARSLRNAAIVERLRSVME